MIIGGHDIFMGAYAERHQESYQFNQPRLVVEEEKAESIEKGIKEAAESLGLQGQGVSVSISKEAIDLLYSEEGFEKIKKASEELFIINEEQHKRIAQEKNPDDVFWNNAGNQWVEFSRVLYQGGFYTEMNDEEVKDFEKTLAYITSGLDHLCGSTPETEYPVGIRYFDFGEKMNFFMTQSEAAMELESSTASLRYLSKSRLPAEMQEEFNQLIDQYYAHNKEVLSEYKNPIEAMGKAIAGYHDFYEGPKGIKPKGEWEYLIMLAKVNKTEEEKSEYQGNMAELFAMFQTDSDQSDLWGKVTNCFIDYSTDHSGNLRFRDYVLEQAQYLFDHMKKCWDQLLGQPEKESGLRAGSFF